MNLFNFILIVVIILLVNYIYKLINEIDDLKQIMYKGQNVTNNFDNIVIPFINKTKKSNVQFNKIKKYPNNIIQTGKGNIKLQHGTLFKTNFFDEQFIPSGNVIINNYSDANDYTNNYFKLNKEHQIININYSENYNTINR